MKNILAKFNKVFENRIRLGLMSALVVNHSLDYNALKELLDVTDGNLASHLKTLESNNFIVVEKKFLGRKPNTLYTITPEGRKAFNSHLEALENLLNIK